MSPDGFVYVFKKLDWVTFKTNTTKRRKKKTTTKNLQKPTASLATHRLLIHIYMILDMINNNLMKQIRIKRVQV